MPRLNYTLRSTWAVPKAKWWRRYRYYLRTREWKARRKAVFARAGNRCEHVPTPIVDGVVTNERCQGKAIHAHHMTYAHVGDERLDELIAVCRSCHESIHGRKMRAPRKRRKRTS